MINCLIELFLVYRFLMGWEGSLGRSSWSCTLATTAPQPGRTKLMTSHRQSLGHCQQQTDLQLHLKVRREWEGRRLVVSTAIATLHIILMIFACCPGRFWGAAWFGLIPFVLFFGFWISNLYGKLCLFVNMHLVEDFYGSKILGFCIWKEAIKYENSRILKLIEVARKNTTIGTWGIFAIALLHPCLCNYRIFLYTLNVYS